MVIMFGVQKRKRLRFSEEDDMALLREVAVQKPFAVPEAWITVKERVFVITGKDFYLRTLKEHLDLLITFWLQRIPDVNCKLNKMEFSEKDLLCEEIHGAMVKFRNKKKSSNKNTARIVTDEWHNKSIKQDIENEMDIIENTIDDISNFECITKAEETTLVDHDYRSINANHNNQQQGEDSSSGVPAQEKNLRISMPKKREKTSVVWNYFKEKSNSDILAICNLCKQEFNYKSSSNNLKKHLERKHPMLILNDQMIERITVEILPEPSSPDSICPVQSTSTSRISLSAETCETYSPESGSDIASHLVAKTRHAPPKQTSVSSLFKRKLTVASQKQIDDNLMLLFIKDFQPFSIVEDYGFKEFVYALNPLYKLPARRKISNTLLQRAYEEAFSSTKDLVNEAKAVTITTGSWTSCNADNFLSISAHFITKDFELKNVLLDCISLGERHSAKNYSQELNKVFEEWEITSKILMVVSDNAVNLRNAVKDELAMKHYGCYAHTINLVVQDALKFISVSAVLEKVKTVVSQFKKSTFATKTLMDQQKNMNAAEEPKELIHDVPTRWNSTYYMIERFTSLKEPLTTTIALMDALPILTTEEWTFMDELVKILKPMETVTKVMSGQNYLTASSVIIIADGLLNLYEELAGQDFMPHSKYVINTLLEGIKNRMGNLESSNSLTFATFLDPRYKNLGFTNDQVSERIKRDIVSHITELVTHKTQIAHTQLSQQQDTPTRSEDCSIWQKFNQRKSTFRPTGTAQSKANIEVQRYLDEPCLSREENPLHWWKLNAERFPNLAEMVQKCMVTVATSVPCEALFTKSGQILSERRTRLSSAKVRKILFLNSYVSHSI